MEDIIVYSSDHPPAGFTADVCGWHKMRKMREFEKLVEEKSETRKKERAETISKLIDMTTKAFFVAGGLIIFLNWP